MYYFTKMELLVSLKAAKFQLSFDTNMFLSILPDSGVRTFKVLNHTHFLQKLYDVKITINSEKSLK